MLLNKESKKLNRFSVICRDVKVDSIASSCLFYYLKLFSGDWVIRLNHKIPHNFAHFILRTISALRMCHLSLCLKFWLFARFPVDQLSNPVVSALYSFCASMHTNDDILIKKLCDFQIVIM